MRISRPNIVFTPAHPNNFRYGRQVARNGQYTMHHIVGSGESAVSVFKNPNRQASSTYVVTDKPGLIYQPVAIENTSFCDGNWQSNSRSITVEHHGDWRNGYRNEVVLDNAVHLVAWLRQEGLITHFKRHRDVSQIATSCSADFPCEEVWNRATEMLQKGEQINQNTQADMVWTKFDTPKVYVFNKEPTKMWNFGVSSWLDFVKPVKEFAKGEQITIYGEVYNKTLNAKYLVTEYSFNRKITNGFNLVDLDEYVAPKPEVAEWKKNLKEINPIKLMVIKPETPILSLIDGSVIKNLGQGTWIDFAGETVFNGKTYLLSSYSVKNGLPNGIIKEDVGLPAEKNNEKPKWLEKWQDIEDVDMYARCNTDLINLDGGETIRVVNRKEKVRITGTVEWYGHKMATIDEKSGIRLDDLDLKPVEDKQPELAPIQPEIERRLNALEKLVKYIVDFLSTIFKNFKKEK